MSDICDTLGSAVDLSVFGMTMAEYAAARHRHPQAVRGEYSTLMRGAALPLPVPSRREVGDGVIKFCLRAGVRAGRALESESVIIPMQSYRQSCWHTLCVSSQVGCRMGCTFCETGGMGLLRNLSSAEIVLQRLVARQLMREHVPAASGEVRFRYFDDGIRNIVFMGMGEPLDNFAAVVQAIRVLNEPSGLDFPHTQITVSTVGRIDGIRRLAKLNWPNLRLAISLNAADDQLRDALMPINKGMPLAELQRTLREYPLAAKGLFLIEYVLLKGVNDSLRDADAVAAWCRPLPCVVNLIPYNPQRRAAYQTPSDETVLGFLRRLRQRGIFVKRRITRGRDLMGACGQLGNAALRPVRAELR